MQQNATAAGAQPWTQLRELTAFHQTLSGLRGRFAAGGERGKGDGGIIREVGGMHGERGRGGNGSCNRAANWLGPALFL